MFKLCFTCFITLSDPIRKLHRNSIHGTSVSNFFQRANSAIPLIRINDRGATDSASEAGARGDIAKPEVKPRFRPGPLPPSLWERDSYTATALAETINRSTHAAMARFTMGLSPAALAEAYFDWLIHLASAPGKQLQLPEKAWRKWVRLATYAGRCAMKPREAGRCIEPLPQDRRFEGDAWQSWPFNDLYQAFLFQQQWWHNATTGASIDDNAISRASGMASS